VVLLMRDWMKQDVLTLGPEASAFKGLRLCRERRIRHIPIVEDDRLVGIVSDRDIRSVSSPLGDLQRVDTLKRTRLEDVMTRKVITAAPEDTIVHAAQEMYERKIECLPVVSGEKLVGIVTSADVMRALVAVIGVREPGHSRIAVQAHKPGDLAEVVGIIQNQEVDIFSVLSSPGKVASHERTLVFQVATRDPSSIMQGLAEAGHEVRWWHHLEQ
jgi:acetoin utilization protein AcuB